MFEIDLKSRKPIYEQVTDKLKERILTGLVAAGERLPSVRELSKALTVNPNTVQKAFRELEREGYIYTVAGLGAFAHAPGDIQPDSRREAEARVHLAEALRAYRFVVADTALVRQAAEELLADMERQADAPVGDVRKKRKEEADD
jgi:GntR family transcriptional regulator